MIRVSQRGSFKRTEKFLNTMKNQKMFDNLEALARVGVDALSSATPVDTFRTASSWGYIITVNDDVAEITWTNTSQNDGVYIAILLQYGHATGTGGYVQGIDYINPAIRPIFDIISDKVWKEVTSA